MDKRYISETEFKSYMDKLISLLEQGSSKEEVLAYLNETDINPPAELGRLP